MISEKKMMKSCSVFYIEQKVEFEKFNCFFIDFIRQSFGRIKVISTVFEKEYTPDITWQICFWYQLTGFKRFHWTVFPNRLLLYFRKPLLFHKWARLLF